MEKFKRFAYTNKFMYLLILFVTILIYILFGKTHDIYHDDGIQHIARAMGTAYAMKNGVFMGNVIPSFFNGFGYSWNLFYGPLTPFMIIIGKFVCGSYAGGYSLFGFISMFLSGITMFILLDNLNEKKTVSFVGAFMYMAAPYHLTDLYTRNAVGEFLAFAFIPLVALGLYNIFNNKSNHYYLIVGTCGLILTHNLTTLIVAMIAVLYVIVHIKELKDTYVIKAILFDMLFTLLITSFFWVPLLEAKFSADYAVYSENMITSYERVSSNALSFKQLFSTQNGAYCFEIGIDLILIMCVSFLARKHIKVNRKDYYFSIVVSLLALWATTKYFPWKYVPHVFYMIQFPWRLLQIVVFFFVIVGTRNLDLLLKKFNYGDVAILSCVATLIMLSTSVYRTLDPMTELDYNNLGISTGREIEIIAGMGQTEYLPFKTFKNKFRILEANKEIRFMGDTEGAIIKEQKQGEGDVLYTANIYVKDKAKFELPFTYYPGYELRIDGVVNNHFFETDNGLLGVEIEGTEDNSTLELRYKGSKAQKATLVISILSLIILPIYIKKKKTIPYDKENP